MRSSLCLVGTTVKRSRYLRSRSAGSIACSVAIALYAQQACGTGPTTAPTTEPAAGSDTLAEVVVTSQHRIENVQDVPIAVTAFSRADLTRFGFTNPTDIAAQTPSLEIKGTQGQSKPNVFLRGVGSNDFNATASNAVGFYTDQVYQGLPSGQLFQMFDLDRVEVLRGPQGTLYGRNTTGGAINFISHQPDGSTSGDFSVTYGRFGEFDVNGAFQAPLNDELSTRLAFSYRSSNGDEVNEFNGRHVHRFDTYAVRDILRWKPTDSQIWTLNVHVGRYDGDGPRYHFVGLNNGAYPDSVLPLVGVNAPYRETGGWWTGDWDLPQAERVDSLGSSVIGEIDFEHFSLTTITAYETVKAAVRYDSDASPLDYVDVVYADKSWMASEELRLASTGTGPLSWITGAYVYRDEITSANEFNIANFARTLFAAVPDPNDPNAPANYLQNWRQPSLSLALFGSTSYQITDSLKATVGIRWTQDRKSIDYMTEQYEPATIGTVPLINVSHENSWRDVTESASIEYTLTKRLMMYASFNRGFKSGEYNGSPIFDAATVKAVNPEYVNAYEIGGKSEWLDNRLSVNIAAFFNNYKDLQVFRFVSDPTTGVPSAFLDNAASAQVKGLEAELHARPVRGLDVEVGTSYLDAKYKRYVAQEAGAGNPRIDFSGNRLVGSPALHFNAAIEYTMGLPAALQLVPRVEIEHNSTIYFDPSNDPLLAQGGYTLENASLGIGNSSGDFEVTAWVKNLSNQKYSTDALNLSSFGLDINVHGAPRTYGISALYHFH